ncbi:protein of unknown function [Methylotuvimicrobium alcaliphilum 20Z]|uniref:Uncharacterized protein n=1 Tax=Methylotuvimicrobium alcaliphilum (strain DSM 19304 / NCIMB 14124 / VKM B-2133 / 20Z) TaxID=1091494 RepID=G4T1A3_META2|nr:protein of unknown function [Methylotuvimicrobium alcaliphilum 20Z]
MSIKELRLDYSPRLSDSTIAPELFFELKLDIACVTEYTYKSMRDQLIKKDYNRLFCFNRG